MSRRKVTLANAVKCAAPGARRASPSAYGDSILRASRVCVRGPLCVMWNLNHEVF